jgi:tetratricopeptide (TPR) repeat protein
VIGVVQVGVQALADRYTYVPYVGLFVAIAWGSVAFATAPWSRRVLAVAGVFVLVVWGGLTWRQVHHWRDSIALWSHSVEVAPSSGLSRFHLGAELLRVRRYEEALPHNLKAAAALPDDVSVRVNLAQNLRRLGRRDAARQHAQVALRLEPGHASAKLLLAMLATESGDPEEALRQFEAALTSEPSLLDSEGVAAFYSMALLNASLSELKSLYESIRSYRRALALRPDWELVARRYVWLLASHPRAGEEQAREAEVIAERFLEARDGAVDWLDALAAARAAGGRYKEAAALARRAERRARETGRHFVADEIAERRKVYLEGRRVRRPSGAGGGGSDP